MALRRAGPERRPRSPPEAPLTTFFDDVDLDRDVALVERFQSGDHAAFSELYRRYFARLQRFCRRRVHDDHTAEEIAQEAFSRAYRNLDRLAGERRFYPWLTVIAARLCVDHHRRTARVQAAADIDTGSGGDPLDAVSARVEHDLVRAAMAGISDRHRVVLDLRESHGLSYDAIAQQLAIRPTAVPTLLHRARQALRRQYLTTADGHLAVVPLAGLPGGAYLQRLVSEVRTRCEQMAFQVPSLAQATQACLPLVTAVVTVVAVAVAEPDVAPPPSETTMITTTAQHAHTTLSDHTPSPDPSISDDAGDIGDHPGIGSHDAGWTDPSADGRSPSGTAPKVLVGPAHVGAGPEAAAAAGQRGSEMPLSATFGPADVGADWDAITEDASELVLEPVVRALRAIPFDRSTP